MKIAEHVLRQVMIELASAFPDQTVTLVLRDLEDDRQGVVLTTDPEAMVPAAILGRYALDKFQSERMH